MLKKALVFVEGRGEEIKEASLEVLGLAAQLAEEVVALGVGPYADKASGYADRVLKADLGHPMAGPAAKALAEAAKAESPNIILLAATPFGKEVGPAAGALLGVPIMADVIEISDDLTLTKPLYTGKIIGKFKLQAEPLLVSVRPKAYPVPEPSKSGSVEEFSVELGELERAAELVELQEKEASEVDVAEADIVVSGGRGVKGPEGFKLLYELAQVLSEKTGMKAAVGASRAAVDEGWIDHSHQVGQTGKIVSPQLYIALGISGAMQHLAGMKGSKVIIAVNKDPEAPIFQVADLGIVDDLFKVVPELIKRLREL